jgi:hypothetical protein
VSNDDKKEYPALRKKSNTRIRQQKYDQDYVDKLGPEDRAWLEKFMGEYASLVLDENGKVIPEQNLHQTEEHKKDIYDSNNARNRDMLSLINAQSGKVKGKAGKVKVIDYETYKWQVEEEYSANNPNSIEDAYINYIDYTASKKKLDE